MAGERHHPDEVNPEDHRELERELRALVPRAPNVELAKLMYLAGQASLSPVPPMAPIAAAPLWRAQWWWPASTAAAATAAAWLAVLLVLANHKASLTGPAPRMIVQPHPPTIAPQSPQPALDAGPAVVAIEAPRATLTTEQAVYFRSRDMAIERGVEALPAAAGTARSPERTYRTVPNEALRRELGISRPVNAGWGWDWSR